MPLHWFKPMYWNCKVLVKPPAVYESISKGPKSDYMDVLEYSQKRYTKELYGDGHLD